MKKSEIKNLLSNMCCSNCKRDFDEDSIMIIREDENLLVFHIVCNHCGKSFGMAILGNASTKGGIDEPLEFQPCPQPINYDDVIDAHRFIDKLEKDWSKYIPENLRQI